MELPFPAMPETKTRLALETCLRKIYKDAFIPELAAVFEKKSSMWGVAFSRRSWCGPTGRNERGVWVVHVPPHWLERTHALRWSVVPSCLVLDWTYLGEEGGGRRYNLLVAKRSRGWNMKVHCAHGCWWADAFGVSTLGFKQARDSCEELYHRLLEGEKVRGGVDEVVEGRPQKVGFWADARAAKELPPPFHWSAALAQE